MSEKPDQRCSNGYREVEEGNIISSLEKKVVGIPQKTLGMR